MDTGRLCMFCMEDNEGQSICPHCGKDANAPLIKNHLKPGEILGGRFLVGRAVGQDASGVVYIVYDLRKERALRIREYLPRGVAMRAENSNELIPLPGMESEFAAGLEETRRKAESADDPSKAMANFEENGTLYVVLRRKKAAPVAAALILADKSDVRRNRVRNQEIASFDIHDRVNYSVTRAELKINEAHTLIKLKLSVDTHYGSVMDYFEIFLQRMVLCRKAAEKLGLQFKLMINEQQLI